MPLLHTIYCLKKNTNIYYLKQFNSTSEYNLTQRIIPNPIESLYITSDASKNVLIYKRGSNKLDICNLNSSSMNIEVINSYL